MKSTNQFMFEGRWLSRDAYRIARGLDPTKPAPKNVRSSESVMAEKKALSNSAKKEELMSKLEEAGETIEVLDKAIKEESTGEIRKYEGEKKVEDMDFFEMKSVAAGLGHVLDRGVKKAELYKLLTEE